MCAFTAITLWEVALGQTSKIFNRPRRKTGGSGLPAKDSAEEGR